MWTLGFVTGSAITPVSVHWRIVCACDGADVALAAGGVRVLLWLVSLLSEDERFDGP